MTNSQPNDNLLRQVERDVLDEHCRTFPLLCRSQRAAIEALLRAYAHGLRDLRAGHLPAHAKNQVANDGLRGMAHCLRWIVEYCPSRFIVPRPPPETLCNEALSLLQWGVLYNPLWNAHSAYSHRLIDVQIDKSAKTITFLPEKNVDPQFFCTQTEAKKADDEREAQAGLEEQLKQLSSVWFNSIRLRGGRLYFDDSTIRRSRALDVAVEWMDTTCLPELTSQCTLAGYTVGDLRRVLAALYVYSLYRTRLEDCSESQPSHGVKFAPCIVAHPPTEMFNWLAKLSGVVHHSVEVIVSTLTFDPKDEHVTLAQQPFISSSDVTLFLLPRMILLLDLPQMIEEMGKWTKQMSKYVKTFRTNPVILGQHFNAVSQTDELAIFGLILVRWPFPVPVELPPEIYVVDWPSLKNHLGQCGAIRASELVKWIRCRPDVQISHLVWKRKEVEVGGWTYKYSVLAPPT